ncbi:hypothetical protein ACQCVP_08965 [Rossellomorea vietnamensis]
MFRREKKEVFLLFSLGYLTPRGWALQLDWGSHLSRFSRRSLIPSTPINPHGD